MMTSINTSSGNDSGIEIDFWNTRNKQIQDKMADGSTQMYGYSNEKLDFNFDL